MNCELDERPGALPNGIRSPGRLGLQVLPITANGELDVGKIHIAHYSAHMKIVKRREEPATALSGMVYP